MRGRALQRNREFKQPRSMRERALLKNTNSNKQSQHAGARIKQTRELKQTIQCEGARIQKQRELKQTKSMRGRPHSKTIRTQTNTINVRPRAFKQIANSIKQCQCAGARIQRNRDRKQTKSMCGRAHSKTLQIRRNKINAKARAFNLAANSRKQSQCAGARIQQHRELEQIISMCGRAK